MDKKCVFVMGKNYIALYDTSYFNECMIDKILKDSEDSTFWLFNKCQEMVSYGYDLTFEYQPYIYQS